MGMKKYKEAVNCYEQSEIIQGVKITAATVKGMELAKQAYEKEIADKEKEKENINDNKNENNNDNKNNNKNENMEIENNQNNQKEENKNTGGNEDDILNSFFTELTKATNPAQKKGERKFTDEEVEKFTAEDQLNRLLQKNYKWKNLNPFVVLMLTEDATKEDIKQRYYKLSSLIHPDRCRDIRAREGFEISIINIIIVKKASEELLNEERRSVVVKLIKGAKKKVNNDRKKAIESGIPESSLDNLVHQQQVEIAKTFADVYYIYI